MMLSYHWFLTYKVGKIWDSRWNFWETHECGNLNSRQEITLGIVVWKWDFFLSLSLPFEYYRWWKFKLPFQRCIHLKPFVSATLISYVRKVSVVVSVLQHCFLQPVRVDGKGDLSFFFCRKSHKTQNIQTTKCQVCTIHYIDPWKGILFCCFFSPNKCFPD